MTDHSALIERLERFDSDSWTEAFAVIEEAAAALRDLTEWRERMRTASSKCNDEICQSLGKALGYPWFKDDPVNFPGATEADGVCVGEHVAESLADEVAQRLIYVTHWRKIETFTGSGQNESVIVAVPNGEGGFIVGEAWNCIMAPDDDYRGLAGWWWMSTSPGDCYADPIRDMNHGDPVYWLPLPSAPNQAKPEN